MIPPSRGTTRVNLRSEIGDLADLKASIPILGIMCPLIIVRIADEDGDYWGLIIGHRRKYGALELGTAEVPCWIAENEDEALKIAAQLAENGHRLGLSATELSGIASDASFGRVRVVEACLVRCRPGSTTGVPSWRLILAMAHVRREARFR